MASLLLVGCCELEFRGLVRLLAGSEIELKDRVPTGRSALAAVATCATRPYSAILVDCFVADFDPLDLMVEFRQLVPRQNILLMAFQENPAASARAAALGVSGILFKSDTATTILSKIQNAIDGRCNWTREELRRLSAAAPSITSPTEYAVPLTHHETDVLRQLSDGRTNKQISQELGISYETVKEHVQHILHKIGVTDRSQAAIWAVRRELV